MTASTAAVASCETRRVRCSFVAMIVLLGLVSTYSVGRQNVYAQDCQPNVLWIMSDDLRPQLGCYGDDVVQTPHIDRFAQRALRFDRAYVQSAICSPSRNSMFSGLRPHTTGLHGFGIRIRDVMPNIATLPQHFKNHGYHSVGFGKIYHIYVESMLGDENDPDSWSDPLRLPTVPVWGPEQNALRDRLIAEARADGQTFEHPHDWPRAETWDDSDVPDQKMQDGELAEMAATFLESRNGNDEPFFLAIGFVRPHLPFNAPRQYWDLYDPQTLELPDMRDRPIDAPRWSVTQGIVSNYHNMPPFDEIDETFLRRYLHGYFACISYVDACVGRVLDALESSGHADNTIVLFMGDHGYQMGEYNSWGHKHSNFEISTRAPLLIAAPGKDETGRNTSALVEFIDLYPTLCELSGLPLPDHIEGQSFHRLLDEPQLDHRLAACSEMKRGRLMGKSIRTDRYRYTEWRNDEGRIVARELYDHRNDEEVGSLESRNVIAQEEFAATAARLALMLQREFNP